MKYKVIESNNTDKIIYFFASEKEFDINVNATVVMLYVDDWFKDLSPWKTSDFEGKGNETLKELKEIISVVEMNKDYQRRYIAGYSLAGLFSLYAYIELGCFDGVGSASGSLWYDGFIDYLKKSEFKKGRVYLSLGDKEELTKHQKMKLVGDNTRFTYSFLQNNVDEIVFEMNQGGHFKDEDLRVLRCIDWLLED